MSKMFRKKPGPTKFSLSSKLTAKGKDGRVLKAFATDEDDTHAQKVSKAGAAPGTVGAVASKEAHDQSTLSDAARDLIKKTANWVLQNGESLEDVADINIINAVS